MALALDATESKVVPIVKIGIERFNKKTTGQYPFVRDENANKLLNDIKNNPHVYVLACLMDKQVKAEKAWMIPQKIFNILGTSDFNELQKVSLNDFIRIFNDNKLHRFNNDMAETFYLGIERIKEKYHGNAAEIWQGNPSSAIVVYRFLEFKGCGIKIATMMANILAREFKIEFSDLYSIDVSPDVQIKRVMWRMGYVPKDASPEMIIYKARDLYPEYPGVIDLSCWEIGREWCRPNNPKCDECLVTKTCKKIIENE
jgi:endonuclease III